MREQTHTGKTLDERMASRLKALRAGRGWSLDELSELCGISRASLSRLENADVSPTAAVLGKLCAAYGLTMSRLLTMVEKEFVPLVPADRQETWQDPETGLRRRKISPPAGDLHAELVRCDLPPGKRIAYAEPPRSGLEHHVYLLEGTLDLTVDGHTHVLREGDCLRYRLFGPSAFETRADLPASYIMAIM